VVDGRPQKACQIIQGRATDDNISISRHRPGKVVVNGQIFKVLTDWTEYLGEDNTKE
jgi:hypothetical protein